MQFRESHPCTLKIEGWKERGCSGVDGFDCPFGVEVAID